MPHRGLIKVTKYNAAQSWRGPSPKPAGKSSQN